MTAPVRFDDALTTLRDAIIAAGESTANTTYPIIVRGLTGRLRLYLKETVAPFDDQWIDGVHSVLGVFGEDREDFVLRPEDFFEPAVITEAEDLQDISPFDRPLWLLDRLPHGEDWYRPVLHSEGSGPPRAVMFGIKGGGGRSTALAVWAWWLARQGKRVLTVDLDLESPGLGPILLPEALTPDFGLVDGLVEDALGQADDGLIDKMSVESPLADWSEGHIFVVPALGRQTEWFTSKLLRATVDLPADEAGQDGSFAARLDRLLQRIEKRLKPDIVLLDSRAGLHDIAAVALTRLHATAFLFAANTPQTWKAYEVLFGTWGRHRQVREFRERMRMVASMVPPTNRDDYLQAFRQESWKVWQRLYDADPAPDDADPAPDDTDAAPDDFEVFNFNLDADEAPHQPLTVEWEERLRHFDPIARPEALTPAYVEAAYGAFLEKATRLTLCATQPTGDER